MKPKSSVVKRGWFFWAHLRNSPIPCAREDFGNNQNNLKTGGEAAQRDKRVKLGKRVKQKSEV